MEITNPATALGPQARNKQIIAGNVSAVTTKYIN